eukprot:scaffold21325_cov94-Skeletonema_dohrnii-CCMP3373.AAC.1
MHHQVTYDVVSTLIRYTIMADYNGSLAAVDSHIHSVRYDMAVNRGAGGRLRCIIRSPTTLYRR